MALLRTRQRATERNEEGLFRPAPRGDLATALSSRQAFREVAPETPRPVEMLEHVTVRGDDKLTADDLALHELLVDHAYRSTERRMDRLEHSIPVAHVLSFLGEHARRSSVKASLARLRSTTVTIGRSDGRLFEDVQLLVPWTEREGNADEVHYVIPRPIAALMASMPRYAYLELEPLSRMKSKYGVRLYRHLAASLAGKPFDLSNDEANRYELVVPVGTLADWLGYRPAEGKSLHAGQFAERAVYPAIADMFSVRRFELHEAQPVRAAKRGAPVEAWRFVLRLRPPSMHEVGRVPRKDPGLLKLIGGVDDPRYRVNQIVWLRAAALAAKHGASVTAAEFADGWLVALREALAMLRDETAAPLTDAYYETERLRGERLLNDVEYFGPQAAAWNWAMQELAKPDLVVFRGKEGKAMARAARKDRFERYRATPKGKQAVEAKAALRNAKRKTLRERLRESSVTAKPDVPDVAAATRLVMHMNVGTAAVESFAAELRGQAWNGTHQVSVRLLWEDRDTPGGDVWDLTGTFAMSQDDVARLLADARIDRIEAK